MIRTVYINGAMYREPDARISIFDRGLLFADAVYEVVGVLNARLVDFHGHMARLSRSLGELTIPAPLENAEIADIMHELVQRNAVEHGLVYMQITRGVADRDFTHDGKLEPTVFMFTQNKPASEDDALRDGVALKSTADLRWARRDIKTTGLLAQTLAKQEAKAAGAYEALMTADGFITEAGAASFYIVKGDMVVTRPLSRTILAGVTRASILRLIGERGGALEERPVTLAEAMAADEAFITGASLYVCPVTAIDGVSIGASVPGPVTRRLQSIYMEHALGSLL